MPEIELQGIDPQTGEPGQPLAVIPVQVDLHFGEEIKGSFVATVEEISHQEDAAGSRFRAVLRITRIIILDPADRNGAVVPEDEAI